MNLILLPGNSSKNREWIDSVESVFSPKFDQVYTQYYDHWFGAEENNEDALIDINIETDKVAVHAEKLNPYVIFAKSAGTLIALKGIFDGVLQPDVCVFVGFPLKWSVSQQFEIDQWLMHYSIPTLFIQNDQDPAVSGDELGAYLYTQDVQRFHLETLDGDTHEYQDVDKLLSLTEQFVDLE